MAKKKLQGVKEIARRANVAIATVDRVIHNRTGVSVQTRERINKIIQELDYQPNLLARRLASGKVIKLAVLIPSVTDETDFWEAPLRGVQRAEAEIRQYGLSVELFLFDLNTKNSFSLQTNAILQADIDGVVIAPIFVEETRTFVADCRAKGIPYVFIDSNIPDSQNLSYIGPPLYQSGYMAGRLCTSGLKPQSPVLLVNIAADIDSYTYRQIEQGFRAYFTDHLPQQPLHRVDIYRTDANSVAQALQTAFANHHNISTVFVTNSRAFLVARFLEALGLSHPPLLIGYDLINANIHYLENGLINFLICHQPEDQGYRSVMSLYQYLAFSATVSKEYYMPIDIITRENRAFYRN